MKSACSGVKISDPFMSFAGDAMSLVYKLCEIFCKKLVDRLLIDCYLMVSRLMEKPFCQ